MKQKPLHRHLNIKTLKHRSNDNALPSSHLKKRDCYEFSEEVQCTDTYERVEEIKKKANHFEWWKKEIIVSFIFVLNAFL